jgi:Na+-transporting methylmalonyl-CoA/oxaloacetate decarboxylase beta subunit
MKESNMKKRIAAIVILACAALALLVLGTVAAVNSKNAYSAGIIGAADGPTSIMVSGQINNILPFVFGAGFVLLIVAAYLLYRKRHSA